MTNVLLISQENLKRYSLINDNTDGKYLLPAIQLTQDVDLSNLIGSKLVDRLEELVSSGDIIKTEYNDYKLLLDNYITDYLIWQVMANTQLTTTYKIANAGVYGNDDEKKNRLEYKNAQLLQEQYIRNANAYADKLKNYLRHNCNKYPEYYNGNCGEQPEGVPTFGIYLGDIH